MLYSINKSFLIIQKLYFTLIIYINDKRATKLSKLKNLLANQQWQKIGDFFPLNLSIAEVISKPLWWSSAMIFKKFFKILLTI
jgi:hypothetical protein